MKTTAPNCGAFGGDDTTQTRGGRLRMIRLVRSCSRPYDDPLRPLTRLKTYCLRSSALGIESLHWIAIFS